ncbi:MAG: hypothetical protein IPH45_03700 [Bacteroidales bacterium]|nr:hypothetical protein [Bacteroidales bacterium]MBK7174063.1 hypothetical protein [Bacteroidales bacterium]
METTHNTIKQEEEPSTQAEPKPEEKKKSRNKFLVLLEGSFLTREKVIRQLPFLVIITLMGVFYIFNSNYADKLVIQINNTKKELKELRYNYINTKSKLMQGSRQSELVNRLASRGVKESMVPPRKIIIEEAN